MSRFEPFEANPQRQEPLSLRIRRAVPDDAMPIAVIDREREGGNPLDVVDLVRGSLRPGGKQTVWAAEADGAIVGFSKVVSVDRRSQEELGPTRNIVDGYYLMGVTVAKHARRRGAGIALTQARLDWIRNLGATEAFCIVNSGNQASISLHRRLGFEELTRDILYPAVARHSPGPQILFRVGLA